MFDVPLRPLGPTGYASGLPHLLQRHPSNHSDHSKEGWAVAQPRNILQRHVQPASTSSTTSWGTKNLSRGLSFGSEVPLPLVQDLL